MAKEEAEKEVKEKMAEDKAKVLEWEVTGYVA